MGTEAPSAAAAACMVAVTVVLGACASSAGKPTDAVHDVEARGVCIEVTMLSEWEPVDDQQLLLWGPGQRRVHLLTLASPIIGLRFAEEVDLVDADRDGFICAHGGDRVLPIDGFPGSASIAAIQYLSEERSTELRGSGLSPTT
jgi:hypothetical protein